MKIDVCGITNQGRVRSENQDSLIIDEELNLYCISDGMGGLAYGKITAEIVRDKMIAYFRLLNEKKIEINCEVIKILLKKISHSIQIMGNVENGSTLYGATLTGMILKDNKAYIMNVGDSRVYKYNQQLIQLTKDQSVVQYMIDKGKINECEAKTHPMRNAILEFMGKAPYIKPSICEIELNDQDIYCICSDGLFSMIDESKIQEIIESNQTLEEKCHQLVNEANIAGGKDNISVILVKIERSNL